jgi:hypothetical protein
MIAGETTPAMITTSKASFFVVVDDLLAELLEFVMPKF